MPTTKTSPQEETVKDPGAKRARIKKTTELSEQVLDQVQTGQRSAIEAVRKFMDSADQALPSLRDSPSRRQEIIDSALEMTERLIQVQYDFVRNLVHSAGETLGEPNEKK